MESKLVDRARSWARFLWKAMLWLKELLIKAMTTPKTRNLISMVFILILTWSMGVKYGSSHTQIPEPEPQIVTVYATPDPDMQEFMNRYKVERSEREANLMLISKVLYGYRNNSEIDLEGIVWVILNRVSNEAEFRNFSTISQVCRQPHQWMGFEESNPVIESLYAIADKVLTKYETNDARLFGRDYLYFEWSSDYIVFKTELYDSKTCKRWRSY